MLFDGKLGCYPFKKIHTEIDKKAWSYHSKTYSVPRAHKDIFLKELKHLIEIGLLEPCGPTEWAVSTFIIPKKDNWVHWISDFRELNKVIKCKFYPLPLIQYVLQRWSGYMFLTKLDITMFYYALELDNKSKELTAIVTPYGKCKYHQMAMGLAPASDEAQEIIK
eukprot:11841204-Ditylum_brightwellii.AAC.2